MKEVLFNLNALELIAIGGVGIALLILAVQSRLAYILQETFLDERQLGKCQPEIDLVRRIRLWSAVFLIGTLSALISLIKGLNQNLVNLFLNISAFFVILGFLYLFLAYVRYIFTSSIIDLLASIIHIRPISLKKKK